MMKYKKLFNDVIKVSPSIYSDERGYFSEDYNKLAFAEIGIKDDFIQDNLSFSLRKNTIRGLHFQSNPYAQSKLIKVAMGSIFDVFVDLRKGSNSYTKCGSYNLGPEDGWLYIPEGYAHGFCTLENKTKIIYKVNNHYNKDHDKGIKYDDPFFSIDWPLNNDAPILSEKDKNLPTWKEIMDNIDF